VPKKEPRLYGIRPGKLGFSPPRVAGKRLDARISVRGRANSLVAGDRYRIDNDSHLDLKFNDVL